MHWVPECNCCVVWLFCCCCCCCYFYKQFWWRQRSTIKILSVITWTKAKEDHGSKSTGRKLLFQYNWCSIKTRISIAVKYILLVSFRVAYLKIWQKTGPTGSLGVSLSTGICLCFAGDVHGSLELASSHCQYSKNLAKCLPGNFLRPFILKYL